MQPIFTARRDVKILFSEDKTFIPALEPPPVKGLKMPSVSIFELF